MNPQIRAQTQTLGLRLKIKMNHSTFLVIFTTLTRFYALQKRANHHKFESWKDIASTSNDGVTIKRPQIAKLSKTSIWTNIRLIWKYSTERNLCVCFFFRLFRIVCRMLLLFYVFGIVKIFGVRLCRCREPWVIVHGLRLFFSVIDAIAAALLEPLFAVTRSLEA